LKKPKTYRSNDIATKDTYLAKRERNKEIAKNDR